MATSLWTPSETETLKNLLSKGKSLAQIGKAIGRSEGAVERRISRLKNAGDPFFRKAVKPVAKPAVIKPAAPKTAPVKEEPRITSKWAQRKQTDTVLHKMVSKEPDVIDALREVSEALETVFEAMKNHRLNKHQLQITLAAINLKEALERELEA